MKRLCFLSLSVFLAYIAGMYRYPALMVLAVGQALLLLGLTVQGFVCGRRMQVGFCRKVVTAVKGEAVSCELMADSCGRLPGGRLRFFIRYGYGGGREKGKRLDGSGVGRTDFLVAAAYCGIAELYLEKSQVYDCLSLGSRKREEADEMRIVVFPKERELNLRFPDAGEEGAEDGYSAEAYEMPGNDRIRQIREYRQGDSVKALHWKLSARADRLLVREYEQEEKGQAELFLDLEGYPEASPGERDAFYELLSALLLGMLRNRDGVRVSWQGEDVGEGTMDIAEPAQCRELLVRLYLLSAACEEELPIRESGKNRTPAGNGAAAGAKGQRGADACGEGFSLDMHLRLAVGGRQLFQFSGERLDEELRQVQITIPR